MKGIAQTNLMISLQSTSESTCSIFGTTQYYEWKHNPVLKSCMFVHKWPFFLFQELSVSWFYGEHRNKNPVAFKVSSYDSNNNNNFDQDGNYIQASQPSLSFSNNTETNYKGRILLC